jgi:hypothetical protein
MADRSPFLRLGRVRTIDQAQNLYKDLGKKLALGGRPKEWRLEAKRVRRELEAEFGDIVRATSSTKQYRMRKRVEAPIYMERRHMTVIVVQYDKRTGEPVDVVTLGSEEELRAFLLRAARWREKVEEEARQRKG